MFGKCKNKIRKLNMKHLKKKRKKKNQSNMNKIVDQFINFLLLNTRHG